MKAISKLVSVVILVALVGVTGLGTYFGFKFFVRAFSSLRSHIDPLTAIVWGVILMIVLIIARSMRSQGHTPVADHLAKQKSEAYQVFVSLWSSVFLQGPGFDDQSHSKEEELKALDRLLILYGGPGVVKAHVALRDLVHTYGAQDQRVSIQFADTLLEIRKDLGLNSQGLSRTYLVNMLQQGTGQIQYPAQRNALTDMQPRVSLASN
jgi:hypothetical protein